MKNNILKIALLSLIYILSVNLTFIYSQTPDCKPFDFNTVPIYRAGVNTFDITENDFNGDGNIDVATVNVDLETFSVVFGDGAGGFSPPTVYPTNTRPWSITSGDLNSDGFNDVIIASFQRNEFALLFNDGNGNFSAPTIYVPPVEFPGQGQYYQLRAGDFNGDSNTDIVAVRNQSDKDLLFFLGNGQGGLTLDTKIDVQERDTFIEVGNLNGDQFTDVVFSGLAFNSRYVAFVYGQAGGGFTRTTGFNVAEEGVAFAITNLDNDQDNDLVIAFKDTTTPTRHYIQTRINNGGNFSTIGDEIDLLFFLPPTDITAADFNNDGKQDIAATVDTSANGGVLTLTSMGNGDGTLQEANYYSNPNGSRRIFSDDLDNDGDTDLVTLQTISSLSSGSLGVFLNQNNTGEFDAPRAVRYGTTDIDAADFNGDNLLDYISGFDTSAGTSSELVIAPNDGNFGLLPDRNFATTLAFNSFAVGDFNGDGKQDAVSVHGSNDRKIVLYLGDGNANLTNSFNISRQEEQEQIVAADFNGDNRDDIFVIEGNFFASQPRGYVYLGNANGTLTLVENFFIDSLNINIEPVTDDFNNDGKPDLALSANNQLRIWLGVGDGTFTQSTVQENSGFNDFTSGDFNGDGNADIAGAGVFSGGAAINILFGNGSGGFSGFSQAVIPAQASNLVSADFNLDGADDILFSTTSVSGNVAIIAGSVTSGAFFRSPIFFSLGDFAQDINANDYNNDGKPDFGFSSRFGVRGVIYNQIEDLPCLTIDDVTITEGDEGTTKGTFTVSLSEASLKDVYVGYSVVERGGSKFDSDDLQDATGRLRIPAGQTSGTISVLVNGDIIDENDEIFTVLLESPINAYIQKAIGIGRIIDDDAAPTLTISDVTANEGQFGNQTYSFATTVDGISEKPVSFRYKTTDGTAVSTGNADFAPVNSTKIVQPGETSFNLNVSVFGDNTFEINEQFFLDLLEAVNITLSDNQAVGTIQNDDSVPTLSVFQNSAIEGDTGTIESNISVQLSNPTYQTVLFTFETSDGTATQGQDYNPVTAIISIPPEQLSADFTNVGIKGDTINEPNEFFNVTISGVTNADPGTLSAQFLIFDDEPISNDFDRDGKTDISVFRPSDNNWYILNSSTGNFSSFKFGLDGDIPVSGDYNGDGRTDRSVWRPADGVWYTTAPGRTQKWGIEGDKPVPGDYDNDGRTDVAVFRQSNQTWYIRNSSNDQIDYVQWGLATDTPVPADYDGDGKTDVAIYRPSDGDWWIIPSSTGIAYSLHFGIETDQPVPADYDGDGKADIAVFRDGIWYVYKSSDQDILIIQWGTVGDKPVPGNYDGDSKTDFAIYRDGEWWILSSLTGEFSVTNFGLPEDIPIPSTSNN